MTAHPNSPEAPFVQSRRPTSCERCGGRITQPAKGLRRFCDPCAERKKREQQAWRKANPIGQVKGLEMACERCGSVCVRRDIRQRWCGTQCRREYILERDRATRAAAGAIVQGTKLTCRNCSAEFIKTGRLQYYCLPCCELAKQEKLPAYRARQLEYLKARQKRRYAEEPAFALSVRISAGIRNSLADGEGKAGRSWEGLVGYTIDDLVRHTERQFLPGMTWENRGDWHIDHVRPLALFTFTTADDPDFKAAWALTNLRPLWSGDNIRKGASRTHLI